METVAVFLTVLLAADLATTPAATNLDLANYRPLPDCGQAVAVPRKSSRVN